VSADPRAVHWCLGRRCGMDSGIGICGVGGRDIGSAWFGRRLGSLFSWRWTVLLQFPGPPRWGHRTRPPFDPFPQLVESWLISNKPSRSLPRATELPRCFDQRPTPGWVEGIALPAEPCAESSDAQIRAGRPAYRQPGSLTARRSGEAATAATAAPCWAEQQAVATEVAEHALERVDLPGTENDGHNHKVGNLHRAVRQGIGARVGIIDDNKAVIPRLCPRRRSSPPPWPTSSAWACSARSTTPQDWRSPHRTGRCRRANRSITPPEAYLGCRRPSPPSWRPPSPPRARETLRPRMGTSCRFT